MWNVGVMSVLGNYEWGVNYSIWKNMVGGVVCVLVCFFVCKLISIGRLRLILMLGLMDLCCNIGCVLVMNECMRCDGFKWIDNLLVGIFKGLK